jgi:hypothetical protein
MASCQLVKVPICEGIDTFKLDGFSEGKISGAGVVSIRNENWFSFTGDSLVMEIFYNRSMIGLGRGTREIEFAKKSSVQLPLNVEIYADSLKDELKTMLHRDSMDVQIVISGRFSRLGILQTAEVNTRIPIKPLINSMLSQSISNEAMNIGQMRILQTDFNTTTIGFNVEYSNQLPFDLNLKKLDFGFYSDREFTDEIGRWNKEINTEILQADTTTISGEVNLSNMKAARSGLLKVMTGGSTWVDYYMHGIAYVEIDTYSIEVPATVHFEMDIITRSIRILPEK